MADHTTGLERPSAEPRAAAPPHHEAGTAAAARASRLLLDAEERAAELAHANGALRAGLDRLAGERDPAAFLRHILAAIAQSLGARGAALFRYDAAAHRVRMGLAVNPDLPRDVERDGSAPFEADADATPYWRTLVAERRPLVLDAEDPAHAHLFWPGTREWHLRNDQPVSVGVPLLLGDEPLGFIGATLAGRAVVTPEQLGLLQALAHQATLALHMTRMAEETRDAAVARERERAAQERAAELARANEALRGAAARLADTADLAEFLPHVLRAAGMQVDAAWAGLFLFEADARTARLHAAIVGGEPEIVDVDSDPRHAAWRAAVPLEVSERWQAMVAGIGYAWFDIAAPDADEAWPAAVEFHRRMGHARALTVPLVVASAPVGFLAFGLADGARPGAGALELVRALADQAALAVRLTELAREAREAAVTVERERASAAVLEERNRIAREIHDTLAHGLAGIAVTLEGARGILARDVGQGLVHVDTALALARESLADARHSLHALRPARLSRRGLAEALEQLASRFNGHNGTAVRVEAADDSLPLTEEDEVELLRIAQEAVSNAVRHARARTVRVALSASPEGAVTLCASDDGRGLDLAALEPAGMVGITGMRERAARVGGALAVLSRPGGGTDVMVVVPSRADRGTAAPRP